MSEPIAVREQVLLALFARLQTLPDLTVERNRRAAVQAKSLTQPMLNMVEMGHTVEAVESSDTIYSLQVLLDLTVPAADDAALGPTMNATYACVLRCAMTDPASGAADFTLGGLCSDIRERGFDVRIAPAAESSTPLADCSIDLLVEFRTNDGNPYTY